MAASLVVVLGLGGIVAAVALLDVNVTLLLASILVFLVGLFLFFQFTNEVTIFDMEKGEMRHKIQAALCCSGLFTRQRTIKLDTVRAVVIACKKVDKTMHDGTDFAEGGAWIEYRYTIKLIVCEPETGYQRQSSILHRERQSSYTKTKPCETDVIVANDLSQMLGFSGQIQIVDDDLLDDIEKWENLCHCLPKSATGRDTYEEQQEVCRKSGIEMSMRPVQTRAGQAGCDPDPTKDNSNYEEKPKRRMYKKRSTKHNSSHDKV